jgi:hypothetical protein
MGINNEYGGDAFQAEDARDDEVQEEEELVLDTESWQDWHSEDILNMWMTIQAYLEDHHISSTVLNRAKFPAFVDFVTKHSG